MVLLLKHLWSAHFLQGKNKKVINWALFIYVWITENGGMGPTASSADSERGPAKGITHG